MHVCLVAPVATADTAYRPALRESLQRLEPAEEPEGRAAARPEFECDAAPVRQRLRRQAARTGLGARTGDDGLHFHGALALALEIEQLAPSRDSGDNQQPKRVALPADLPADKNWIEDPTRLIAIGGSKVLFAGSPRAGQRAAALMSLLQSARRNGLETYSCIKDVLTRLPTRPTGLIDEPLPHRWQSDASR